MEEIGTLNEYWSKWMIKELIYHGVRTFCIAPGSRNAPLIIAAVNHPLAETIMHYDERGLAFHALGYAKGSGQPVAIIVTSGSAVGNLLPAVMEGYHDHIPLILLTADRPPELRDTGANQTTNQTHIFHNFIHWECDFPCPDQKISPSFIGTTVANGMSYALSEPQGPIHFNCMFRKPLYEIEPSLPPSFHAPHQSIYGAQTIVSIGKTEIDKKTYQEIGDELAHYQKGIILVGGTAKYEDCEKIYALSRLLQWPIFPDILSIIRSQGEGLGVICYYHLILKAIGANKDYSPDAILQLGDRFISDKLIDWIAMKNPKMYCHVASHINRKDPIHAVTHRIVTNLTHFIGTIPNYLHGNSPSKWFKMWKTFNQIAKTTIASYFKESSLLTESYLFHSLMKCAPASSFIFFQIVCLSVTAIPFLHLRKQEKGYMEIEDCQGLMAMLAQLLELLKEVSNPL